MEKILYTEEQVQHLVRVIMNQMEPAASSSLGQLNLDNSISYSTSPSDARIAMTVREAADEIGISKPKMYELVKAGKVHSVKVGKKILISRQSLTDWISKGE